MRELMVVIAAYQAERVQDSCNSGGVPSSYGSIYDICCFLLVY